MGPKRTINFTRLKGRIKIDKPEASLPEFLSSQGSIPDTSVSTLNNYLTDHLENQIQQERPLSSVTVDKLHNFALGTKCSNSQNDLAIDSRISVSEVSESRKLGQGQTNKQEIKYTPLEQQYLEIKSQYPDVILFVECGYKYRFFGEDAKIASEHLNISCNTEARIYSASIPVQRLNVHVRRLVASGYKVGIVKQTESSALKAFGDHKNDLFERKLTALYTRATLIGQDVDTSEETEDQDSGQLLYMVCIYESQNSTPRNTTNIGLVGLCPTTGDGCYWWGQESVDRKGLELCLEQIQPVEILIPRDSLSAISRALLSHVIQTKLHSGEHIRLESIEEKHFEYASALLQVSQLYRNGSQELSQLPPEIVCATAALMTYLDGFKLNGILNSSQQLTPLLREENTMYLSTSSIRNLEIFYNCSNFKEHSSLFWTLNKTKTAFGRRQLKRWLANPLCSRKSIIERQDVVAEILHSKSTIFKELPKLFINVPDLETAICATLQLRVSCERFYVLIRHLAQIHSAVSRLQNRARMEIKSSVLNDIFEKIPLLLNHIPTFYCNLDSSAAKSSDVTSLFVDVSMYDDIVNCRAEISRINVRLEEERLSISRILDLTDFHFTTVGNHQYLIEVKNSQVSDVPSGWIKMSGTKQVSRFRSSQVENLLKILSMLKEKHRLACHEAWNSMLLKFNQHFFSHKEAICLLASMDCYFSLAEFSRQDGFCRPHILPQNEKTIKIVEGRHPVLEKTLSVNRQYVRNDTHLSASKICMVLTGPNMGGKSSYLRQVALLTILAQLGAHVPAQSAEISVVDAIYTRMGAKDEIFQNRSTFMVEMQEASDILHKATEHSLVILDELGRGTSTHDGAAIAYSTLHYIVSKMKPIL